MDWPFGIGTAKSFWRWLKTIFRLSKRVEALEKAEQNRTAFGPGRHTVHLHAAKPGHYSFDLIIRESGHGEIAAINPRAGRDIRLQVEPEESVVVGETFEAVIEHRKFGG